MQPKSKNQQPLTKSHSRFSRLALLKGGLAGIFAMAAFDGYVIEPHDLRLELHEVPIADLPRAFDGYRIALMADFHYPRWISPSFLRRAIGVANSFKPDLMAFCGDFFDIRGMRSTPSIAGLYDDAHAPDGVVGVLGNHDHGPHVADVRREIADSTPIKLIENVSFLVKRGGQALAIGGVGDLWHGIVEPQLAFESVPPNVPRILLSHNPDLAEEKQRNVRVDLQLSGHTHGGQVHVPFGPAIRVPSIYGTKFAQGLVQGASHRVFVTRGLCTVRWVRFACPPEVTGIVLRCMSGKTG